MPRPVETCWAVRPGVFHRHGGGQPAGARAGGSAGRHQPADRVEGRRAGARSCAEIPCAALRAPVRAQARGGAVADRRAEEAPVPHRGVVVGDSLSAETAAAGNLPAAPPRVVSHSSG
ncbi:hypothetical protein G6F60_015107 [Rhizopus arrhizus]|nr:hypothetical protein G6F60_015107 [Rhizopus arrhizus]